MTVRFRPPPAWCSGSSPGCAASSGWPCWPGREPASKQDTRALRLLRSAPGRGLSRPRRGHRAGGGQAAEHAEPAPPPGLAFRLARRGGVGALAANSTDRRTVGVASGSGLAGAAAGTYAGAYYRRLLPARTHTPDLPWAMGEDVVAAGLAATAVKVWPEPRPWWRGRAPGRARRAASAVTRGGGDRNRSRNRVDRTRPPAATVEP